MRYKDYQGPVEDLIRIKLKEIEEKENVRVLHAVESGSRAWGFASLDSDYDVRFVYIRPLKYYLSLQQKTDFINWELDETLDINGWDMTKALQHFHKSNATLYEWANSPVVYHTTSEWKWVMETADQYFSCKSAMYHYYGTARKNYTEYLTEDMVKYKKYFYVLRPVLACKWIEKKKCPPPVLFQELVDEVLEPEMYPIVESLVQKKVKMAESEKGNRIDTINDYIVENLLYFKKMTDEMPDNRRLDWESLNQLFLEMLQIPGTADAGGVKI